MNTKHICIWGAPGTGKSTIASGVFHEMKKQDYDVEMVLEYAKKLVFSKDYFRLKDQLYILAKQSHPWFRLDGQVDFTVNDSPFLMGLVYTQETKYLPLEDFKTLCVNMYKRYDTLNIFLVRNHENRYTENGRLQTLEESMEIEKSIGELLIQYNIPNIKVFSDDSSVNEILKIIKDYYGV
jgi:2-phosphoglycerate kinase